MARVGRVLRLLLGATTVVLVALQMLYRIDLPAKAYTYASQVAIAMQMITTLSTPNTTSTEYPIDNGGKLPDCLLPTDLGPVLIKQQDIIEDKEAKLLLSVKWGGVYAPHNCTAKWKVAIIVPYRDRRDHLARFLKHMHPFLIKQQIHYGLFVIEQLGVREFNRGKLLNVGFVESQKLYPGVWQCFIFHDVDLLPLNSRNVYACPRRRWPRHMSAAVDKFGYGLPYDGLFGGVSALTSEQFTRVNGFSNEYWGWGGEDNDMFKRLKFNNYTIARYDLSIARYVMLKHNQQVLNPIRHALLSREMDAYRSDGLSNLEYYVMKISQNRLFTHILVDIG